MSGEVLGHVDKLGCKDGRLMAGNRPEERGGEFGVECCPNPLRPPGFDCTDWCQGEQVFGDMVDTFAGVWRRSICARRWLR